MSARRRIPKRVNDGLTLIAIAILVAAAIISGGMR